MTTPLADSSAKHENDAPRRLLSDPKRSLYLPIRYDDIAALVAVQDCAADPADRLRMGNESRPRWSTRTTAATAHAPKPRDG